MKKTVEKQAVASSQNAEPGEAAAGSSALQQVTVRVSAEAVHEIRKYAKENGLVPNRLFDEAFQVYAALLKSGVRVR